MSLDQTAIKEIQELTIAAQNIEGADYPVAVIPGNMKVESLEQFQKLRNNFRGAYETNSINEFSKYVEEHQCAVCFVDENKMSAKAIFDLGTIEEPGHGKHTAKLSLVKTGAFEAILSANGAKRNQQSIIEWIEDWRNHIQMAGQDGEDVDMKKGIAAIRRISIEQTKTSDNEEGNFKSSKSTLDKIEAKGVNESLPAFIRFMCKPYLDFEEYEFSLRLSVLTDTEKPTLKLQIVQLELANQQLAESFKNMLLNKIVNNKVFLGTFTS